MWFIILQDLPVHLDQPDQTVCYIYLLCWRVYILYWASIFFCLGTPGAAGAAGSAGAAGANGPAGNESNHDENESN